MTELYAFDTSPIFFVTATTWQRKRLLDNELVHRVFREHGQNDLKRGIAVGRYVIMPEHLHFFIRLVPDGKLSVAVKFIKESITKALRQQNSALRVWQPGFFDHRLRSADSYAEKWEYVFRNPERAGLVARAEDWPYQGEIVSIDRV